MKKHIFLCLFLLFSASPAFSQKIIRIIPGYVLIDVSEGLGKIDDHLYVYRKSNQGVHYIGTVKIIKFNINQTAAKIVKLNTNQTIQLGDYVSKMNPESVKQKLVSPVKRWREPGYIKKTPLSANAGVRLGMFAPATHLAGYYTKSPSLGIYAAFLNEKIHTLYIDLNYVYILDAMTIDDPVGSALYHVHICDRLRTGDRIFYEIGAGIYYFRHPDMNPNAVKFNLGLFYGLSLDLTRTDQFTLSPSIRAYTFRKETRWYVFAGLDLNVSFKLY